MARHKNDGKGRIGGRQKGTPNKRVTLLSELLDYGKNPIAEILSLLPHCEPQDQLNAWLRMLQYCYPQFKAFEITAEMRSQIQVTQANVGELYKIAREAVTHELDAEPRQLREASVSGLGGHGDGLDGSDI